MNDLDKWWSTVGSAGTSNATDLSKLILFNSVVQLGPGIAGAMPSAVPAARGLGTTVSSVVRYNVTPVDGVANPGGRSYGLRLRFRDGDGHVVARLIQVNIENGTETPVVTFDSRTTGRNPQPGFQTVTQAAASPELDFLEHAYYVELTLSVLEPLPGMIVASPPAVSIIQLMPIVE
jgi:hypothetical protein